jgi:PAS domain S-box-containing protein
VPSGIRSLGERILSGQGPEFVELLEALGEAIVVRDRDDRFVYANRVAARRLGFESSDEMLGLSLGAILERFIVHDEHGRPVTRETIPSVRLMEAGATPEPQLVQTTDRRTGERRWERLNATPLRGSDGTVIAAVTVIEDVTAVKTAEVHTRVLAESGRVLAASLDYQQTLRNVAKAALPGLADFCLVELVEGGVREAVVVAHIDAELEPLARRLRALETAQPNPESAITRVLASGESEYYPEVTDAHLQRVAVSAEQLQVLRDLEIRSSIVVPMRVGGRITGAMSFFTSVSRRRLDPADVEIAEQLARRAAVATENSRLHTTLADVARTLQRSLLPPPVPPVDGWEIATLYRPAVDEPRIEVGGDFYEIFDTSGNAFALIGDVTGHGVAAATLTSLLRHGARFASHLEPDPVSIIRRLDDELRRLGDGSMATALCAALHDHSLILCSAGHPPALVASPTAGVREATGSGPLLGAFADSVWNQERMTIQDDELVLLYTDGITETFGDGDRFGIGRLRDLLSEHVGSAPHAVLQALDAELNRFRGGPAGDDIAAVALRPHGR